MNFTEKQKEVLIFLRNGHTLIPNINRPNFLIGNKYINRITVISLLKKGILNSSFKLTKLGKTTLL